MPDLLRPKRMYSNIMSYGLQLQLLQGMLAKNIGQSDLQWSILGMFFLFQRISRHCSKHHSDAPTKQKVQEHQGSQPNNDEPEQR